MATKTRTIEYAFDTSTAALATNTTLGTAGRLNFTAITVYIPESSITFKSVRVEVTTRTDTAGTNGFFIGSRIGINLASVGFSDSDYTGSTLAGFAGWIEGCKVTRDVTSYFTTNWSGTSMTCQVGVAFATTLANNVTNVTAKLLITYTYSDASSRYIKTVRIPIQSSTSTLTNSLTEIGVSGTSAAPANQIPALDTFLPESSKVYRQVWVEFYGNDGRPVATATAFNLQIQIDSGSTVNRTTLTNSNGAAWFLDTWIYDTSTYATNAAHALKLASSVTTRFPTIGAVMHVTYEYDPTGMIHIQSLKIPLSITADGPVVSATATADADALAVELWVEEPDPITLVQSGVLLFYSNLTTSATTLNLFAGGQAERGYTVYQTADADSIQLVHRCDQGTSPWTLARGRNRLVFNSYASAEARVVLYGGFAYINYTSGKFGGSGGCSNHNQSCNWSVCDQPSSGAATTVREIATATQKTPDFSATHWFLQTIGMEYDLSVNQMNNTVLLTTQVSLWTQVLSGELATGKGWRPQGRNLDDTAGVQGRFDCCIDMTVGFNKTDQSNAGLMVPTTARKYRAWLNNTVRWDSLAIWTTFNTMTFTVAANLTGYSGDGSGITVDVFNTFDNSYVASATSTAGGAYSATVYDSANSHYGVSRQSSSRLGRSDNGTPS